MNFVFVLYIPTRTLVDVDDVCIEYGGKVLKNEWNKIDKKNSNVKSDWMNVIGEKKKTIVKTIESEWMNSKGNVFFSPIQSSNQIQIEW